MPRLGNNTYGKKDVRVTKIVRHADRHELVELSVDVELTGDFAATYLTGDNSNVVATDSMKNAVYVLALKHPLDSIEPFALALVRHFIDLYPQVATAAVHVRQNGWQRINLHNRPHPHAFVAAGNELRTCRAAGSRQDSAVAAGLLNLMVLKTTDSAFANFVRDDYTTLKDATDRILATSIDARWHYAHREVDYNASFTAVREALLETFAAHHSVSVQQTLYAMGEAAMARCAGLADIQITLPNKHRILVNLSPFGLENQNEVFVWTDEPYGNITGHITRS
jgi:urate oxidase